MSVWVDLLVVCPIIGITMGIASGLVIRSFIRRSMRP